MTNKLKLKEILEKFEQEFPNMTTMQGEYYYGVHFEVKKDIKDFIRKSCIEYARSVVPEDSSFISTNPGMEAGYRKCINFIQGRISQDELSLGEEDT